MGIGAVGRSEHVEGAIRRAAQATGVDFDFLLRTARRESALDPRARAGTSSAAGLFQFIEQTWLATLKKHGSKHGYGAYADLIRQGRDGRYAVDPAARRAVLDLRFDPKAASLMAAELASDHAAYLRGRTGREPSAGELYAAHFLGPEGAARLIRGAAERPGTDASSLFPEAAAANRSIFRREGRPATLAELYANLTATGGRGAAAPPTAAGEPPLLQDLDDRLARLRAEQSLLSLLLGGESDGGSGGFLAAFGPSERDRG